MHGLHHFKIDKTHLILQSQVAQFVQGVPGVQVAPPALLRADLYRHHSLGRLSVQTVLYDWGK